MKRFFILLSYVFITWLIHLALVTIYMGQFADTHAPDFRIFYALELSITFSIMLLIYLAKARNPAQLVVVLATTVGYLAIVDTLLSITQASVRSNFDPFHFAAAYALMAIALTTTHKVKAK